MITHRVIADDDISIGKAKRRRLRVLLERGSRIDSKDVRDLAFHYGQRVQQLYGGQDGISIMFYTELFTPTGILGSWDRCPGGRWANAYDAPQLPQQWVITRGVDADLLLKMRQHLADQARSRRRDGGNVEGR